MEPRAQAGDCPPHHWQLTTAMVGSETCYHHACVRCGAQKDTPVYGVPTRRPLGGDGRVDGDAHPVGTEKVG
jgi:hypothetical protein